MLILIRQHALAGVRQLLVETDLKLETIAQRSGFHSIGYLGSYMKKKTGLSPGSIAVSTHGGTHDGE